MSGWTLGSAIYAACPPLMCIYILCCFTLFTGKGRGRQVIAVARTADLVMMMLDASKGDIQRQVTINTQRYEFKVCIVSAKWHCSRIWRCLEASATWGVLRSILCEEEFFPKGNKALEHLYSASSSPLLLSYKDWQFTHSGNLLNSCLNLNHYYQHLVSCSTFAV